MSRKACTLRRVVVKHQQDASKGEHDEQVKSDSAHPPGEIVFRGVAIYLGGVKMKKNVGQHAERAVAWLFIVLHAENGAIELSLLRLFQPVGLLFGFSDQRLFERRSAVLHFVQDAGLLAVSVFFGHRS